MFLRAVLLGGLIGLAAVVPGWAQYLGVDRDGDMACTPESEMVIRPGEEGPNGSFTLFFSDMPNPLGSVACTFCVHDSSSVVLDSFVFHSPAGWTNLPLTQNPRDYSDWISDANRKAKCWVAQASDMTFTRPWDSPSPLGTAYFTAAGDEPIHIILDPIWSAYFTSASSGQNLPVE